MLPSPTRLRVALRLRFPDSDKLFPNSRRSCAGPHSERVLAQEGFTDTVVWNPGREKAAAMPDLGEGYRAMLCVEAAAVEPPVRLRPGERWEGVQAVEAR